MTRRLGSLGPRWPDPLVLPWAALMCFPGGLVGQALVGSLGPYGLGACWIPSAHMGRAAGGVPEPL